MKVRRNFKGIGPYPSYVLPSPASTPMPSTTPYATSGGASTPSFAARPSAQSLPSKPIPPPIARASMSFPSRPASPDMPGKFEATYSASTSPASSTPPSYVNHNVRIVSASTMGLPSALESRKPTVLFFCAIVVISLCADDGPCCEEDEPAHGRSLYARVALRVVEPSRPRLCTCGCLPHTSVLRESSSPSSYCRRD